MFRSIYDRLVRLAGSKNAPLWLFGVSFAESSFFPIPPDALLVPMVAARPQRAWFLAAICTLGSVLGGCLGYLIGAEFFDQIAMPLLRLYHIQSEVAGFQALYAKWGLMIILVKGLTPIPYKLVTIASGAAHFSFPKFVVASAVTRGARFFIEAELLRRYGEGIGQFVRQRPVLVSVAGLVGLALVVVAIKYIEQGSASF